MPHQAPKGFPLFVTWNLKGSLPQPVVADLERERERLEKETRRAGEADADRQLRHAKLLFAKRDAYLDTAHDGPRHLHDPRAAAEVVESIIWGVPERYDLYAFVVMANHVHALLTPQVDLEVCTQGIKGYTAYRINLLQNQRGRVFWQDESYDHWARDEEELLRIIAYIENNPVAAGLCARAELWEWSSAVWRKTLGWKPGQKFQPEWKATVVAKCRGTSGFPA